MTVIRSGTLALLVAGTAMTLTSSHAFAQKKQRDLITRAEIESSPKRADYIYDVIRSLRPHFLEAPRGVRRSSIDGGNARLPGAADPTRPGVGAGGSAPTEIAVFVDQNHSSGIDVLGNIRAELVEEVRYFDPSKAVAEFGITLGGGGAIVVKMSKNKPPEKPPAPQ